MINKEKMITYSVKLPETQKEAWASLVDRIMKEENCVTKAQVYQYLTNLINRSQVTGSNNNLVDSHVKSINTGLAAIQNNVNAIVSIFNDYQQEETTRQQTTLINLHEQIEYLTQDKKLLNDKLKEAEKDKASLNEKIKRLEAENKQLQKTVTVLEEQQSNNLAVLDLNNLLKQFQQTLNNNQ